MDESESEEKKGSVTNIINIHGPVQLNEGPGHLKNANEDRSVNTSGSIGTAATGDNHSGDMTTTQTETHQEEKPEAKQENTAGNVSSHRPVTFIIYISGDQKVNEELLITLKDEKSISVKKIAAECGCSLQSVKSGCVCLTFTLPDHSGTTLSETDLKRLLLGIWQEIQQSSVTNDELKFDVVFNLEENIHHHVVVNVVQSGRKESSQKDSTVSRSSEDFRDGRYSTFITFNNPNVHSRKAFLELLQNLKTVKTVDFKVEYEHMQDEEVIIQILNNHTSIDTSRDLSLAVIKCQELNEMIKENNISAMISTSGMEILCSADETPQASLLKESATTQQLMDEVDSVEFAQLNVQGEMEDLATDAVGEPSRRDSPSSDKLNQNERVPISPDTYKFDIALLFSDEDEKLAEKIQSQMSDVKLKKGEKLTVCLYNDPVFGGSITERPRKVIRQCRFVFVMLTEHTQTDTQTVFAVNDLLGYPLAAPERRNSVIPLYLQDPFLCKYKIPAGLASVKPVHWIDSSIPLCKKSLAKLVNYDKYGSGIESSMDTTLGTIDQCGSQQPMDEGDTGEFAQIQRTQIDNRTKENIRQGADVFLKDSSGSQYSVKIQGMSNIMIGHRQTMNVTHGKGEESASKARKINKLPITTSTDIPQGEAMELVSSQIGRDWKKLGRELGLSDGQLETVRIDYNVEGHEEVVYQMLRKWNTVFYPTSLAQLAKTCVSIGRGDVADGLTSLKSVTEG